MEKEATDEEFDSWMSLKKQVHELESSLNRIHDADHRGIKMWQDATGRDKVWPDRGQMIFWLLEQNEILRRLVWLSHWRYAPGSHMPYGDDGQMQCCGIDFIRTSVEEMERILAERSREGR